MCRLYRLASVVLVLFNLGASARMAEHDRDHLAQHRDAPTIELALPKFDQWSARRERVVRLG